MSIINNLKKRLDINNDSDNYLYYSDKDSSLQNMQLRLNKYGGTDQWTRMREDKLRSLKKSLLSSYQSAIIQKYNVENDSLINSITSIVTSLENNVELTQAENVILNTLEEEYPLLKGNKYSDFYINQLYYIIKVLQNKEPLFRCLINHDKLKVDYQDKIISIPFEQPPIGGIDAINTDFHNGTVFKWVHGNKEEWTPDTYWIVYMQYSEETAYFRAEIRKADEQIQIITIDSEGNQNSVTYRGWMTGPNETTILWNHKKKMVWNDMNYTKLLYITKDQNTLAFFQRFDRIIINGKPWEVQAYNDSYSTSKAAGTDTGIIRVALKETYTSTDQFVREKVQEINKKNQEINAEIAQRTDPYIDGPTTAKPYSTLIFYARNFEIERDERGREIVKHWSLFGTNLARIIKTSPNGTIATVEILTGVSNKEGFYINYGDSDDTMLHVTIESF